MQMPVSDISRFQAAQVSQDGIQWPRLPGETVKGDNRRETAIHCWANAREPLQNLGLEVRTALGKRIGKENWHTRQG